MSEKRHPDAPIHFSVKTSNGLTVFNQFDDAKGKEFRFNILHCIEDIRGLVGNVPYFGKSFDALEHRADVPYDNADEAMKNTGHMEFHLHSCESYVSSGSWQFLVVPRSDGAYVGIPHQRSGSTTWVVRATKATKSNVATNNQESDKLMSFFRNKRHHPFFECVPDGLNCFGELLQPVRHMGMTLQKGCIVSIVVNKNEQPTIRVCTQKHADAITKLSDNSRVVYKSEGTWFDVHPADVAPFSIVKRDDSYLEIRWFVSSRKELIKLAL